jgi:single-strand DNA-binding protein
MSLNQCNFIGNLGRDVEVRTFQNGDKVANLRIAVTEKWKDKTSGERKEMTEWVTVAVFGPLAGVAEQILSKGSKVFVSGKLRTRKWQDQSGQDRYSTEVILQGPQAILQKLDGARNDDGGGYQRDDSGCDGGQSQGGAARDLDDEIPF